MSESSSLCEKALTTWDYSSTHAVPINSPRSPFPLLPYIDGLPPELLEEIFWQYLHGKATTLSPPGIPLQGSFRRIRTSLNARATPFTLAHVCSSWRTIAMSSASLWSQLCASRPEAVDVSLFEFWLSRSSGRPLDLTIVQKPKTYGGDVDIAVHRILSLAIAHSVRWRSVSLYLEQDMEPLITKASAILPVSSLQNIELDFRGWTTQGEHSVLRAMSRSPNLTTAMWGLSWQGSSLSQVSWARLSKVHFDTISLSDLHPFLEQTTTLTELTVDCFTVDSSSTFLQHCAANTLQLPSLTTLSFIHYNDLSPLFNVLSLPSLSALVLSRGMGADAFWVSGWTSLYHLVQRSGCQIQSLTWSHYRLPEVTFITTLIDVSSTVLPRLSHLNISSAVGNDTVKALLPTSTPGGPIFPGLRFLEMEDCRAESALLEDLLKSRPNLERAYVELYDQPGSMKRIIWTPTLIQ